MCGGGGVISLIITLYKIKQSHKKEQRFYQQAIAVFPEFKRPPLSSYPPLEVLKLKNHLSYKLGEALMQAGKNWYKGGYFKFFSSIQKAKEHYKTFQSLKGFLESYATILNTLPLKRVESLIQDLQDNPREDTLQRLNLIAKNIDFKVLFSKHLDFILKYHQEILEWLESKEFQEQYLDTNHPYPPLINPKRLTKESNNPYANLSYESIPAELAWEMNLPLPKQFLFIYRELSSSASWAIPNFLQFCGVCLVPCTNNQGFMFASFKSAYYTMLNSESPHCLRFRYWYNPKTTPKFIALSLRDKIPFLIVSRDPIERLLHAVNHLNHGSFGFDSFKLKIPKSIKRFNLTQNPKNLMFHPSFALNNNRYFPSVDSCLNSNLWCFAELRCALQSMQDLWDNISEVEVVDFLDMKENMAFETLCKWAVRFGFDAPNDAKYFQMRQNRHTGSLYHLPVSLFVNKRDLGNEFWEHTNVQDSTSCDLDDSFEIKIGFYHTFAKVSGMRDISGLIFEDNVEIEGAQIVALLCTDQYDDLLSNRELFVALKRYVKAYILELKENESKLKASLITQKQLMEFLCNNKTACAILKEKMAEQVAFTQRFKPKIVESWKYYQEFLRMCEELDKENA